VGAAGAGAGAGAGVGTFQSPVSLVSTARTSRVKRLMVASATKQIDSGAAMIQQFNQAQKLNIPIVSISSRQILK
jgi:hypothetical protein